MFQKRLSFIYFSNIYNKFHIYNWLGQDDFIFNILVHRIPQRVYLTEYPPELSFNKFLETVDNQYSFIDSQGNYWCVLVFITDAYTVDSVQTEKQAFEASKTYGKFQKNLSDFNIKLCHTTIPDSFSSATSPGLNPASFKTASVFSPYCGA